VKTVAKTSAFQQLAGQAKGPNFWLLNVLRKKLGYPEMKRAVREQSELFAPRSIPPRKRRPGPNSGRPGMG
jgi:hypothetical protein